jgi:transcription elongation factor GreB
MGRYRPPPAKKSPYITLEGYKALQEESKALWKRRTLVTKALTAAAAEGDRSENAEYIYRKKELREIDRRIHYLQKRLPVLTVVSESPANSARIFFGARVTLETYEGAKATYRIVGPDELDPKQGYISVDSPLGRALLKKSVNDEVSVRTPQGGVRYLVVAVEY